MLTEGPTAIRSSKSIFSTKIRLLMGTARAKILEFTDSPISRPPMRGGTRLVFSTKRKDGDQTEERSPSRRCTTMSLPLSPPNSSASFAQLELFQTEKLTDGLSRKSRRKMSLVTTFATSSQALASGATPSSNQGGPEAVSPPGPPASPVSHSPKPVVGEVSTTLGTSGQSSSTLFNSRDLASSLANRLRVLTASRGSTLYSMTWKTRVTPARRQIPQLLATARHRRGSDSIGSRRGWATPRTSSSNCSEADATRAFDGKSRLETEVHLIPRGAQPDSGVMHFGFSVLTACPARLDPDFVRWLTGLPGQWSFCGLMATLAMPKPQSALQLRRERRFRKLVEVAQLAGGTPCDNP